MSNSKRAAALLESALEDLLEAKALIRLTGLLNPEIAGINGPVEQQVNDDEVVTPFGSFRRRSRVFWSDEETQKLIQLRARGKKLAEIARILSKTTEQCKSRLRVFSDRSRR